MSQPAAPADRLRERYPYVSADYDFADENFSEAPKEVHFRLFIPDEWELVEEDLRVANHRATYRYLRLKLKEPQ